MTAVPTASDVSYPITSPVTILLDPWPSREVLLELAAVSGVPSAEAAVSDFERVWQLGRAEPWNDTRISIVGYADGQVTAYESDFARSQALRKTRPPGGTLPFFGSSLGLNMLPVVADGVVLARRAQPLAAAPDQLWVPTEGLELNDLTGHHRLHTLDLTTITNRLCTEELGLLPTHVIPLFIHLEPGNATFSTLGVFAVDFSTLVTHATSAPDGSEQSLVLCSTRADVYTLAPKRITSLAEVAFSLGYLPA